VKKPCLICGALAEGSYCKRHQPWRPRGRVNRQLRARVFATYGRRCMYCGRSNVPLEVHHVNGDPIDNRIQKHDPAVPRCHHKATFPRT
jgi:5-methylcytosine-specific restriction endonuclease McrA